MEIDENPRVDHVVLKKIAAKMDMKRKKLIIGSTKYAERHKDIQVQ